MDSRRDFIKRAAFLAAGGGLAGALSASIQRALAIDPPPGASHLDAEHVVILMQENRSFDHCFGSLRGVRGFNDPRAVTLPDGNPVWLQTNRRGETYAPFRLDLARTKATWMGSLDHSWETQTDARNHGRHDGWLDAKAPGDERYARLPLTLGFYNREDLPFYYALADAFTVCDQNFCSSLTATTPNRLHLWTGTIRETPSVQSKANIRNEDTDYGAEARWKTFPERLEEAGISWRVYQNEINLESGLGREAEAWLANFSDNPLEWFEQYHVRFASGHRRHLAVREKALTAELAALEAAPPSSSAAGQKRIQASRRKLEALRLELSRWSAENFAKLSLREQNLHRKAFTTNESDPDYRALADLAYQDGPVRRRMEIPRGDVLHQFRQDVRSGALPAVSWIVPPERFSDHPSSAWYGAWYVSETLDILTQNPDVWKKTIFILCYDENDGYFDHVPPFVPPDPERPETGRASPGIDTSLEHVRWPQEEERRRQNPGATGRAGPIGLGFRVPLVVASPWSRGGAVCSQVFDHTSILRFLEVLLTHKTGRTIRETNITSWRRAICGDLTSVFQPSGGEKDSLPPPVPRDAFLEAINQAAFKPVPSNFKRLSAGEIAQAREHPAASPWLPRQEKGVRPSRPLPYELAAGGSLSPDRKSFEIRFSAENTLFGDRSAGAPFHVYAPGKSRLPENEASAWETGRARSYAAGPGESVSDLWSLDDFAEGVYHLRAHGPNGFFREFRGAADDPGILVTLEPTRLDRSLPGVVLRLANRDARSPLVVLLEDASYGEPRRTLSLAPSGAKDSKVTLTLALAKSFGWHDLVITVQGAPRFLQRYSGRVETGQPGFSDPAMGA